MDPTQRELRYTAIADLRTEYHPGDELDCIVKGYNAGQRELQISVKETESNPFEGAELRHPVGRRLAVIAGKYGGRVFCNLNAESKFDPLNCWRACVLTSKRGMKAEKSAGSFIALL